MVELNAAGLEFSELLIEVFRVNGLALAARDRLTQPVGLTSARWQVMGVVDHAPVTVPVVARTMGLTRQSVRETADALQRAGFLAYTDNPHHRTAKLLTLTESGRRALRRVERLHATWASRLGSQLDSSALRRARSELQRVRESLERELVPAKPDRRGGDHD